MLRNIIWSIWYIFLSIIGLIISVFLFIPYYRDIPLAFCGTGGGCNVVKDSDFSHLFGLDHWFWSLPFLGIIFYSFLILYNIFRLCFNKYTEKLEKMIYLKLDLIVIVAGFLFSVYLTGLEAFVIFAWCSFCLIQFGVATVLFVTYTYNNLVMNTKNKLQFLGEVAIFILATYLTWFLVLKVVSPVVSLWIVFVLFCLLFGYILLHFPIFTGFAYRFILKPILFCYDAEDVHKTFITIGKLIAKNEALYKLVNRIYGLKPKSLHQNLLGINFTSPVGLSAGFDYNGELTGVIGKIGFGFESAGTVTYSSYVGNPKPRLARLPKSKSLLVNKGFKNMGLRYVLENNLSQLPQDLPVGLSIGATNSPQTATATSQIKDILKSFEIVKNRIDFAYFELNISCPNVKGSGVLDKPDILENLLAKIDNLRLTRPLFVKLPAEIEWSKARELIQIMIKYKVAAVIVSNLVKNRNHKAFDKSEIESAPKGNFSGKPVEEFSNILIENIYKEFRGQILIIGVGGIFTAEDAYKKIKLGANLVQMITGMVYRGPSTIWEINQGLDKLLQKDGYKNISEAVGANLKTKVKLI